MIALIVAMLALGGFFLLAYALSVDQALVDRVKRRPVGGGVRPPSRYRPLRPDSQTGSTSPERRSQAAANAGGAHPLADANYGTPTSLIAHALLREGKITPEQFREYERQWDDRQ